ncbi:MAG: proline--tRNA ligase, partial [Bdellovibrionales bacterium]|nr:proline--tRNA ligase [Bdellovibrionales bacterium]
RPRFGLMRAREFIMKDAYSFDVDEAGLHKSYMDMHDAYHAICKRIGFAYRCVDADAGAIGGKGGSQEFMVLAENGEDTVLFCSDCDYGANQERAESILEEFEQDAEQASMEAVFGEGLIGVEPLAEFLKIPVWKTTKTLLMQADDDVVAVMVRGDCDVNEIKVQNFLGCKSLALAAPEVVKQVTGAEVGYAGPVGLPESVRVIADHYVDRRINFECGANQTNYHNINVNFGRDVALPEFGDFKLSKAGDTCPCCKKGTLSAAKGIEVGHIFKLGTKYTDKLGCTYLDQEGKDHSMVMGCYGIGISRMAAACVEQNHDADGIVWPVAIAPYAVHLVGLNLEDAEIAAQVEQVYQNLKEADVEVLYDDRELRAGEKFSDADLLGMPYRITVSKRALNEGQAEVTIRKSKETSKVPLESLVQHIKQLIGC